MSKETSSPVAMGVDSRGFSRLIQESKRKHIVTSRRGQGGVEQRSLGGQRRTEGQALQPQSGTRSQSSHFLQLTSFQGILIFLLFYHHTPL